MAKKKKQLGGYVYPVNYVPQAENGWLSKYEDGGEYIGTTNKGFDYNGAWGGQWQDGGEMPQAQDGYAKNNLINRVFNRKNILENQILQENKALKEVAPLRKFHVDYSNPEDTKTLESLHHNPEYISPDEGVEEYNVGDQKVTKGRMQVTSNDEPLQTVNVKYPGHYTTLINPRGLGEMSVKDAAALDFVSHSLHANDTYNKFSDQLKQQLISKYGQDHLEQEGGVDAYVRGIMSPDNNEYKSYKEELKQVDPSLISSIKNYIKTGKKFAIGGSLPGASGMMYARTGAPSKGPRRNQTDVTDASAQNGKEMKFYQEGLDWTPRNISKQGSKIKKDDNGYWNPDNWGKPVEIGSNEITMDGVYEPLLGISDTGDTQMMYPGEDYTFDGNTVTEYPVKKNGGWLSKYE